MGNRCIIAFEASVAPSGQFKPMLGQEARIEYCALAQAG